MKVLFETPFFDFVNTGDRHGLCIKRNSVAVLPYTTDANGIVEKIGILHEWNTLREGNYAHTLITGTIDDPFFSIVNTLFTTIFGRRLGTVDDGTSLRATPNVGTAADLNTSTISPFSSTTRDITLTRAPINIAYLSRLRGVFDGVNISHGFAYAGPRYATINREILKSFIRQSGTNYSIEELGNNVTFGTQSSLDGQDNTLLLCSTELGRFIKTKLSMPSEIFIISPFNQFDNTPTKFDQTIDTDGNPITFDDTTP